MNSVSIFLLMSDIIPRLMVLGIILSVFSGALAFALPPKDVEIFSSDHNPFSGLVRKETYIVGVIGLALLFFTPSKEVFYMIAASEIGEQIIELQEVQEIGGEVGGLASDTIELLRQNIQEQLTEGARASSSKPVEG